MHGKVFITRNLSRVGGKAALTTSLVEGIKLLLYAKIDGYYLSLIWEPRSKPEVGQSMKFKGIFVLKASNYKFMR